MPAFRCTACGATVTKAVKALGEPPERAPAPDYGPHLPSVPRGRFFVDPEPYHVNPPGAPAAGGFVATSGMIVLNPGDVVRVRGHPEGRGAGCCGSDGQQGLNLVCARCGAELAVASDDCWTPNEVRLHPAAVARDDTP